MQLGFLPILDHYYQPLINPKKHLTKSLREDRQLRGIDFNIEEQLTLLKSFRYNEELLKFPIDKTINTEEVLPAHRKVIATLSKLATASTGYRATPKNTFINRKRLEKGKPALTFNWVTVTIEPPKQKLDYQGGTHASPRRHQVRGHWRTYKSGARGWVKDCWKGDASKGSVFKDYKVKEKNG
jgi:hypothetical protein